jgi:iron(III) transport system permease protein
MSARPRLALPRIATPRLVLTAVVTVASISILGLLMVVVWLSMRANGLPTGALTLDNFRAIIDNPLVSSALRNTAGFALTTVAVAVATGVPLAWLVERTDFGWTRTIYMLMVVRILISGFFTAMGWMFLLHPRIGSLNQWLMDWLSLESAPINIVSVTGMGVVQGLGLSALVFIMVGSSLRAMDAALEESARANGASVWMTFRRVTLPLLHPSRLGATLFVFAIAVAAFDVPLIIGFANRILVFSTMLYVLSNPADTGLPEYGISAAFSTFMIIVALGFSWWYTRVLKRARNFQVITGRGYQPQKIALGRWRAVAWLYVGLYLLATTILPLLMVSWVALQPFVQRPSLDAFDVVSLDNFRNIDWSFVQRGVWNTVKLMILAPTISLALSVCFGWIVVRSRLRMRLAYDYVAFLPQAVPQ